MSGEQSGKVDFFVKASLPSVEVVFFNGQIFDAYKFVCWLVKSAKQRIILIDNYVDESVLTLLDKREFGVSAEGKNMVRLQFYPEKLCHLRYLH